MFEFDFTIIPNCGKSNTVADAFSEQSGQIEKDTLSNTKLLINAIQRTKETGLLETNAITHVTKNTKSYETLKNV